MRKNILYCHHSFSLENIKGASNYKIIKSGRSLDLAFQLGAMTMIGLFSFNAYAVCTPTPDCASIGYTETSCETDYLACPFDSTKLKCIPCDSSFRYDCSGDNIVGGTGSACGGKYVSCKCSVGGVFKNGACACDDSCTVGAIYYSDGTCSACVDSSKTAIGIVVKDNELVISQMRSIRMSWSSTKINVSGITEAKNQSEAKQDFNGKANTLAIVAAHPTETTSNNAAINCNSYSTAGTNAGDWYLPAAGELYSYVSRDNYSKINTAMRKLGWTFSQSYFWSSSVYNSIDAWRVITGGDDLNYSGKTYTDYAVSCFLALQLKNTIVQ